MGWVNRMGGPGLTAEEIAARRAAVPRVRIACEKGVEKVWLAEPPRSRRMIEGIASTPTVTAPNVYGRSVSKYSRGATIQFPVPLLSEHGIVDGCKSLPRDPQAVRIGEVIAVAKSRSAIWVRAIVYEGDIAADRTWSLIERGVTGALSVLASDAHTKAVVDGVPHWDSWRLKELSICRDGANPDCFLVPVSCEPGDDLPSLEALRAWRARQQTNSRTAPIPIRRSTDSRILGAVLNRAMWP